MAVCLLLGGAVAGHSQVAGVDTIFRLHGTVINGITGKPLARALVTSGDRRLATMTGNEGQFAIDISVPARQRSSSSLLAMRFGGGMLMLTAQKPGYIALPRPALLPLDDTISSTSVELKLMPTAVVTGRVSSAATDSASNVRVTLMQHQVSDGERFWVPAGSQTTNSHGEFRFTDLRPGEYTLMTGEWQGEQQIPRPRTEITEFYPPVYYGDAHSFSTATKLNLHYGDAIAAEFHLHLATYYPIVVPVSNGAGPVSARVDTFGGFQLGYNGRDGAVEGSLPNGDYNLLLTSRGPNQQQSFAVLPLHVAGASVHTASVALTPPSTIEVRVHTQFAKQENAATPVISMRSGRNLSPSNSGQPIQTAPPTVQVMLRSEESRGGYSSSTRPNATGDLSLENVQPGHYSVHVQPFRGYVASMTSGGVDLLQHQLIVGPGGGGEPIDIVLRDDTATLNGTVSYGSDTAEQSMIMLLPIDAAARLMQSYAGPDGKFTVPNLPPGSYRVLAFRGIGMLPQIAWHDAETMHRYDRKGATVTVAAGQTQSVDVHLLDEADAVEQ